MNFTPTKSDLKATFEWLKEQSYAGVLGACVFDSGVEGPTFGVTIHTHGNEPCGLGALWSFKKMQAQDVPFKGRIIFTLNNIRAAEKYWQPENNPDEFKYRFLDVNMNRVPLTFDAENGAYEAYEYQRIQELYPVWQEFDFAVDFHTTSQDAPAMVIANDTLPVPVVSRLPVSHYLEGVAGAIRSCFVTNLYGKESAQDMYMVECGQHEALSAFSCAVECFWSLADSYGISHSVHSSFLSEQLQLYKVVDSCFFPDESYEQCEIYENFAPMKKGQVLATGRGAPVVAPFDGHILMAPSVKKPAYITEEMYFFSEPVVRMERDDEKRRA